MNEKYVIDENVLIDAWHGKKPDGTNALAERKFICDLAYGEAKIAISVEIKRKIIRFCKDAEKKSKGVDNLILPIFIDLMNNYRRTQFHAPQKNDFPGIKKCDKEFVGVALKSESILVTADKRLKDAIQKDKKVSNCDCQTAEEVIERSRVRLD